MLIIKICGITRLEDAEASLAQGAQALGFVFWPDSPRFIDPYRARAIVSMLPAFVTTVGVFVNQPSEYVNGVASLVGLAAVQLHGDETPSYAAALKRPIVKAIALSAAGAADAVAAWPLRVTLLLDAHDPVRRGGTGTTIDWALAAPVAAARRVLLAGGLTPENVGEAIGYVKPFGIDVSSGVESSPGIKDHGRLKALFEAVAAALEMPNGSREEKAPAARAKHRREARRGRAAERERAGVGSPRASGKG
jgi:phosphoribosylanthranilate isomerase